MIDIESMEDDHPETIMGLLLTEWNTSQQKPKWKEWNEETDWTTKIYFVHIPSILSFSLFQIFSPEDPEFFSDTTKLSLKFDSKFQFEII